jgi:carbamoyl-phosphate synthase small subunit
MNVTGKEKLLLKIMVLLSTEKNLKKHNDEITHYHINDNTVAGMKMKSKNVFRYNIILKQVLVRMILLIFFDEFVDNIKRLKKLTV